MPCCIQEACVRLYIGRLHFTLIYSISLPHSAPPPPPPAQFFILFLACTSTNMIVKSQFASYFFYSWKKKKISTVVSNGIRIFIVLGLQLRQVGLGWRSTLALTTGTTPLAHSTTYPCHVLCQPLGLLGLEPVARLTKYEYSNVILTLYDWNKSFQNNKISRLKLSTVKEYAVFLKLDKSIIYIYDYI